MGEKPYECGQCGHAQALFCTLEFTLERNHLHVMNAGKLLVLIPTHFCIREFKWEKNLLGVVNVGRLSVEVRTLLNII